MTFVLLLNTLKLFAGISAGANVSVDKVSFSNVSSYMAAAGAEVRFSKENRYAVAEAKYLYPVHNVNRFNGIPQSVSVSVGLGKTYLLNVGNTKIDADLRLSFVNLGIDRINLYSLLKLCGTLRHQISGIDLLVPVSCAISVNGYSFCIGVGLQHTWGN